jgi:hypothetical protein
VRRWRVVLLAFALGALCCAAVVLAPAVALHLIRPRLERSLGMPLRVGAVTGRLGRVVLADVRIGEIARFRRVTIHYRTARLLIGRLALDPVEIDGAIVNLTPADLRRLRGRGATAAGPSASRLEIGHVRVAGGRVRYRDAGPGLTAEARIDLVREPRRPPRATLRDVRAALSSGPTGGASRIDVSLEHDGPRVEVRGGRVAVGTALTLSDIEGSIVPRGGGRLALALWGGWGDAATRLWKADGTIDPGRGHADVRLAAQRFRLDRLGPVLAGAPILDPHETEVDADLTLRQADGAVDFEGHLDVFGLTIFHPGIGPAAVRDLDAEVRTRGRFDARARKLRVDELLLEHSGVRARVAGTVERLGTPQPRIEAKLEVPPLPCRRLLAALPEGLFPIVRRFQIDGSFSAELHAEVDFAALESVALDGRIGIDGCRVVVAPPEGDAKKLLLPFSHRVRPMPDVETTFEVGPANRDFTPLGDVSTHLVNSIMTTEDSRFFDHRGFIGREFRSALARDLRERRFALGASSITMQMVKNVMLTHEKTLARKLQELFLTWHVEQTLPKERILEIYLNVIELGPGIYGIGAAARHYFGKSPRDLTPREAAFFSSILPSPKRRYVHYCHGVPSPKWERYLDRILRRMHERGRLSQVDLEAALASPLVFDRVEARPEVECLRFVKQIVEANQVPVLPDDEPLRENPGGVQNEPPGRSAPTPRPGDPP